MDGHPYLVQPVRQFRFYDEDGEFEGLGLLTLGVGGPVGDENATPPDAVVWGRARGHSDDGMHEGIHPDLGAWENAVKTEPVFVYATDLEFSELSIEYGPF
jgi:hypothetical protein